MTTITTTIRDRRIDVPAPIDIPDGTEVTLTIAQPIPARSPRPLGVPAATVRGIAAGNGPPPDDETIDRWIDEQRTEKFG